MVLVIYSDIMVVSYASVGNRCKEMSSSNHDKAGVLFQYCYESNMALEKVFELKCVGPGVQAKELLSSRQCFLRNMVLDHLLSFSAVEIVLCTYRFEQR